MSPAPTFLHDIVINRGPACRPARERTGASESSWSGKRRFGIALSSLLLGVANLLAAAHLSAQPFSTLTISAGAAADLDIGRLAEYWETEPGAFVRITTPFHLGSAAVAVQRTSFPTKGPSQPDFRVLTTVIEWNADVDLPRSASVFGGIQAGSAALHFDDNDDIEGNENENEFLAGIQAGIVLPVARGVGLTLLGSHRKVFTRIPMRLTSVGAGLHITFRTPGRLRAILE